MSGQWSAAPTGQLTPPPSARYEGGGRAAQAVAAPPVPPRQGQYGARVVPQRASRNAAPQRGPQRARSGGPVRPAYAGGTARVTPGRAQRHTRAAATAERNQVLQKRLIIAGVYVVAMIVCWFYVFPFLESILPSEF